jgi:hypothetical protein
LGVIVQVLVCKDVLDGDYRANAVPAPAAATPSGFDAEKVRRAGASLQGLLHRTAENQSAPNKQKVKERKKNVSSLGTGCPCLRGGALVRVRCGVAQDALADALAQAGRDRDGARGQAAAAAAALAEATVELVDLRAAVASLRGEMFVMRGEAAAAGLGLPHDRQGSGSSGSGGGGWWWWWWWWFGGASGAANGDGGELASRHAQLLLALWGTAAALAESESARAMGTEVKPLRD